MTNIIFPTILSRIIQRSQKLKYLSESENEENVLTVFYLEHQFGAWAILALGLTMATVIFIQEYLTGKKKEHRGKI